MKKTLYLIRHAESTHNVKDPNKSEAEYRNCGLSPRGIEQAKVIKGKTQLLIVSPLRRTMETYTHSKLEFDQFLICNDAREWITYGPSCLLDHESDELIAQDTVEKWDLRIKALIELIKSRPESIIGILSHGATLFRLIKTLNIKDTTGWHNAQVKRYEIFFVKIFMKKIISFKKRMTECGPFQKKFCVSEYLGLWYEIARLPTQFGSGDRNTATYSKTVDPNVVNVYNVAYNKHWVMISNIIGTAVPDSEQSAALTVTFPPPAPAPTGVNYIIHATDYDEYSLVGSCDRVYLFILSREKTMSEKLYCQLVKKAKKLGYNVDNLIEDYRAVRD